MPLMTGWGEWWLVSEMKTYFDLGKSIVELERKS